MPFTIHHIKNSFIEVQPGTEVAVVADHGNVVIVQNREGIRFSVKADNLTDQLKYDVKAIIEAPQGLPDVAMVSPAPQIKKANSPKIITQQTTLF